jgi:predicted nucleic acid-binding protein
MSLEYSFILDTNVLVSALLSKNGKARQALDKAQNIGRLLMSESTFLELVTVLERPKFDRYISSGEEAAIYKSDRKNRENGRYSREN